ncbi:murein DD-endopeptidase MepM [Xenorhabdus griffiniae]|uniref:Murein DD-endopeptidase MepM n=1 Tax=Xenorhabdus griffiniae TaxID=351672 RepID=A0ABY9XCZ2_9GAMM|nr:murein DD-endopeptidase MepM [Xenorhabdus griffiniae]MBD1227564.1 murein DD-endopeptidase MepM [Xenorhabdus griffiniae]MBE8587111.1 murein DD-endopeptidase MepM [Xenorhabdus griffiniae]WMV70722.1 murein DD-endopeptidase MepM [Xenorhabdus griffiniae]WNH00399.1 murein DD-endopeptidase MepM [Xenorhabdus griffiniae]
MQQIAKTIVLVYNNLPKPHKIMLGSLTLVTLAIAIWRPVVYHEREEQTGSIILSTPNRIPEATDDDVAGDANEQLPNEGIGDDDGSSVDTAVNVPHQYVVSSGDTLSSILTQFGIDSSDVALLANQYKSLRNLGIGQSLSWTTDDNGNLKTLTWNISRRETRVYTREGDTFNQTQEFQKGEWKNSVIKGTVDGSFNSSALVAGLTSSEAREVTKALQWQIDFRKLRKGDRFSVLMSREMLDGKSEQSQLLGVRLQSGGNDYYAFRADDGRFYDSNASGLERGFLRFPTTKQFRVSSSFNPHRLNPVTGRITAHRGVDFAMPVGTPVLAVGDGEVVVAKFDGAAGNFIAIRHGRQYTTRYMHLRKILVKPGQKVKRGERIALSGNTGRSTGPHLHFEFWDNQRPVNPLTAKLPRAGGLSGKERTEYVAMVQETKPQLLLD